MRMSCLINRLNHPDFFVSLRPGEGLFANSKLTTIGASSEINAG